MIIVGYTYPAKLTAKMLLLLGIIFLTVLQSPHLVQGKNCSKTSEVSQEKNVGCRPWFYFNPSTEKCECFHHPAVKVDVLCTDTEALLSFGSCMTYNEQDGTTSLGQCDSFLVHNRNVSSAYRKYLKLPKNLSELNDYMCTPMNRKGLVCSECIDGFGPAIFSYGFQCANCTGAWYGIPVYLCLEFVPITLFYLFILAYPVSVTEAPMTSFVLYSQLSALSFVTFSTLRSSIDYELGGAMFLIFKIVASFYGIFNLDFFRYILPPFCVSPALKQLYIVILFYISAFYPLLMIIITWTCIELHSRNYRLLVRLWNKVNVLSRRSKESKGTIVDVFATFLLLSYTKMMQTSLYILFASYIVNINDKPSIPIVGIDLSIRYFSAEHVPFAIFAFAILIGPILLPVLLLAFYPIRICRSFLEKCGIRHRTKAALDIFVQKFYSCYRDGLNGGRDMRSWAFLYFFLRILIFLVIALQSEILFFFCLTLIFCGTCLFVAIVRPYKKRYMNNIDILVLTASGLLTTLYVLYLYLTPGYSTVIAAFLFIVYSLPFAGFVVFLLYMLAKMIPCAESAKCFLSRVLVCTCNKLSSSEVTSIEGYLELPDSYDNADH